MISIRPGLRWLGGSVLVVLGGLWASEASSQTSPATTGLPGSPAASSGPAGSSRGSEGAAQPVPSAKPRPAVSHVQRKTREGGMGHGVSPRPPSAEQLRALDFLGRESAHYERASLEQRQSANMMVRHHYEEQRRRLLSALDRELLTERGQLSRARDRAIAQYERFVAKYSGVNSHPSATPDAMFRLAALYEERARADIETEDLGPGLLPAIDLYLRIIRDFPEYEEVAAVHYYLGHAYMDSATGRPDRLDMAQQAWRSLVCSNRFQVKSDPGRRYSVVQQPLEQDHDQKFWNQWHSRHPIPLDQAGKRLDPRGADSEEELVYRDPYANCTAIPQSTPAGEDPRYLAETWWQLGNHHFDQIDPKGGPYNLNRAVSAYAYSMQYKKPPLYGVAMYKLAWTYFKQQCYRRSTEEFIRLLHYADEQERRTGDPGADFRSEAYTYVAGSLTYVDFDGPPAEHPHIPRNDVLDTEPDPILAEEKMAIGMERIQDPTLIPQDRKWTVELYKALAQEYIDITHNRNAVATLQLTLQKFPWDRDAPSIQSKIAELYDQLARLSPEGSAARQELSSKALKARTMLANYVGPQSAWVQKNIDDPEAILQAEQLANLGLKRAAADHTNYGRGLYQRALELNDAEEQRALVEKAVEEYRLAAVSWRAYHDQDRNALDFYETKFWLADAHYWVVVLQVALNRTPADREVKAAHAAAVAVRDSNEDDKYLQPAAYYVVTIYERLLEDQYRLHQESGGTRGLEKRAEVRFEGGEDRSQVVVAPIPGLVQSSLDARDAYIARVPMDRDPEQNGLLYAFQAADTYFLYGHFDQAKERFTPIFDQYCGKNEWGYRAWEKLISMSNFRNDTQESRRLAETKSCAVNEDQNRAEQAIRKPVGDKVAYMDAGALFDQASKLPDGPARKQKWREAAAAYRVALEKAPERDEAAEAAMNGAFAYKQVGEYDKAIVMYELFISRYGNGQTLTKLRDGDPKAQPPAAPDKTRYEERVKYLRDAHNALANSYVLFFNYPRAAETFDHISKNQHFESNERREASRQALSLYASLGDRGGMNRARLSMRDLGASSKELAEADYVAATAELKRWDEFSPDAGANAVARRKAQQAMGDYYQANHRTTAAAQYVVQAAYHAAKMAKASRSADTNAWWKRTVSAFERWKGLVPKQEGGQSPVLGSTEAAMAAEAEYTMLDAELAQKFDFDAGHHRYKGTVVQVIGEYRKDAVKAKAWHDKLQHVVDAYVSPEWTVAAISRQGSLYDSLRTGLYETRPPALKMFDAKTEKLLKMAERSGRDDLQEKADEVRVKVQTAWSKARGKELDSADQILVQRYATAIVLARRYSISNPAAVRAIRRLAFLTDVLGEARMQTYVGSVADLQYEPGMFAKIRPGMVTAPKPVGLPLPLPVQGPS
ncbi:tol-pal system YbgF family protein [Myxococcota bacterium]